LCDWLSREQAAGGHAACVRTLLLRGAAVGSTDHHGDTALHLAVRSGRVDCVRELVNNRYLSWLVMLEFFS
jgi:ankyrin repeat protein